MTTPTTVETIMEGVPPGTPLHILKLEMPTGRRATLVVPNDMTAAEIEHLIEELDDFTVEVLMPLGKSAADTEAKLPESAKREPWK